MMHIWQGKLNLKGPTEVDVRIVVRIPDVAPEIDVGVGTDSLGQPRWRVGDVNEFDPWSIVRALAMTQPGQGCAPGRAQ